MSKQDRQGVRTPADVEIKYGLGKNKGGGNGGSSEKLEQLVNQLNQTLSQFMASVTAKFNGITEKMVEKVLKTGSETEYKTLSDNDLTDKLKSNYDSAYDHSTADHAPASAQENVIEEVKVNGTALSVEDKAVSFTVPTKVSELENDEGYLKEHQSLEGYARKEEIPIVPENVSEFVNDADYADRTYVAEVASGKCKAFTFDTVEALDAWLSNGENTAGLNNGDVFYIRAVGVPDYWWDKDSQSKQILETTKVDLEEYALKAELPEIPSNVSAFNNDAGYLKEEDIPDSLPANGGNADTVCGIGLRISYDKDDPGQMGFLTVIVRGE